jgi:hypothetical protein
LANRGIGIDTSIASSNEVVIAIGKQNQKESKVSVPAKVETKTALKELTPEIIAKMKSAVADGKKATVEKALSNYNASEDQKKEVLS